MWICDNCLEINDDQATLCAKCGEDRPHDLSLKEEIAALKGGVPTLSSSTLSSTQVDLLIVDESTNSSPTVIRIGLVLIGMTWITVVIWLLLPIVGLAGNATGTTMALQHPLKSGALIPLFIVVMLPLLILIVPTTRWEFDPSSATLTRTRGNQLGRKDEAVYDLNNILEARISERSSDIEAHSRGGSGSDSDGFNLTFGVELVLKDGHSISLGPRANDVPAAERRVQQINHFLHRWQRDH